MLYLFYLVSDLLPLVFFDFVFQLFVIFCLLSSLFYLVVYWICLSIFLCFFFRLFDFLYLVFFYFCHSTFLCLFFWCLVCWNLFLVLNLNFSRSFFVGVWLFLVLDFLAFSVFFFYFICFFKIVSSQLPIVSVLELVLTFFFRRFV